MMIDTKYGQEPPLLSFLQRRCLFCMTIREHGVHEVNKMSSLDFILLQ
jgi:hypothetical protein